MDVERWNPVVGQLKQNKLDYIKKYYIFSRITVLLKQGGQGSVISKALKPCVVQPIGWTGTEIQELKGTVEYGTVLSYIFSIGLAIY